ncbi:MAG: B3/B4 domain-containing protein [Candidatus Acidiferrales bacterium]
MEIRVELPGVKLGVLEADAVKVEAATAELAREMAEYCERRRKEISVEQVMELEAIRDVRAMFRAWEVDPARYRPSGEALLRRVAQGKGLYRISNVVDASNLGSIETGWPYGTYDRGAITPPVTLRAGAAGETYQGIGKQTWHLEGRPVLADVAGAFGSPISDSTRSMVTDKARDILSVIFAPQRTSEAALREALGKFAKRLEVYAGAAATRTEIIA